MLRGLKLAGLAVLLGSTAFAEPSPVPTPAPAAGPPAPADISVGQQATLSGSDMLTRARVYRAAADPIVQRITGLLEQATKDKDIIRVNCLKDKLSQLKAATDMMDREIQNLSDAVARNIEGDAHHSYTRVAILNQKIKTVEAAAEECVGQALNYVGATKVEVETPPGLTELDVTQPAPTEAEPVIPPPPPPSSPWQ